MDNDEDAVGPTVQDTFSESGVYRVICRVQNDEGLVSDVEILVTVTDAESGNEIGLDDFLMALGAILLLLVFSFMAYLRIASNRRMAALLAESETEAEKDQTASREPSAEEQKAMWGALAELYQTRNQWLSGILQVACREPLLQSQRPPH